MSSATKSVTLLRLLQRRHEHEPVPSATRRLSGGAGARSESHRADGRTRFLLQRPPNTIEAADEPAEESWRNITAMDDFVLEVLNTRSQLTIAALGGNAGAGGALMALAADRVYARRGVVLNPHYKGMGGLYGSEYWTYTLPRRVGRAWPYGSPKAARRLAHAGRKRSASSTTPSARMSGLRDRSPRARPGSGAASGLLEPARGETRTTGRG